MPPKLQQPVEIDSLFSLNKPRIPTYLRKYDRSISPIVILALAEAVDNKTLLDTRGVKCQLKVILDI